MGHNFNPDGVIGIATGGILPAKIISDNLNIPVVFIKVARPMTSAKKYLGLSKLPQSLKSFLRRIEMSLGFYRLMESRTITEISGELIGNKYIIVDDSLDTGKTVNSVLKYLLEEKKIPRNDVIIAVITQIFDDADPQADCLIYKNFNFCFPRSRDSNEYQKFLYFCREHNILNSLYL